MLFIRTICISVQAVALSLIKYSKNLKIQSACIRIQKYSHSILRISYRLPTPGRGGIPILDFVPSKTSLFYALYRWTL